VVEIKCKKDTEYILFQMSSLIMEFLTEKVSVKETFIMTLFMTTGLIHPILLVWLSDQGATDPSAMLYIASSSAAHGMRRNAGRKRRRKVCW